MGDHFSGNQAAYRGGNGSQVESQVGRRVPVYAASQVALLESGAAPSKIRRRDLLREVRISAGTEGRSLGEVVRDIKLRADALHLPQGFRIDYTGDSSR